MPGPVLMPFMANAVDEVIERVSFETNVITADDGSEQRVQLRKFASGGMDFSILLSDYEYHRFVALIYSSHFARWYVPLWHYACPLAQPMPAGAATAYFTHAGVPFYSIGGAASAAALWTVPQLCEVLTISSLLGTQCTFITGSQNAYPQGGGYAIPVRVGWLAPDIKSRRLSPVVRTVALSFDFDGVGASSSTAGETQPVYDQLAGFDVLEADWIRGEPGEDELRRDYVLLDGGTGARVEAVVSAGPSSSYSLKCQAFGRPQAFALRSFIESRAGRAVPFWLSLGSDDLRTSAPVAAGATTFTIAAGSFPDTAYGLLMFPAGNARRYVEFRSPSGQRVRRGISSMASPNTATLSTAPGVDITTDWRVSFLLFCRLDSDDVSLSWGGTDYVETSIAVRELPSETPVVT